MVKINTFHSTIDRPDTVSVSEPGLADHHHHQHRHRDRNLQYLDAFDIKRESIFPMKLNGGPNSFSLCCKRENNFLSPRSQIKKFSCGFFYYK